MWNYIAKRYFLLGLRMVQLHQELLRVELKTYLWFSKFSFHLRCTVFIQREYDSTEAGTKDHFNRSPVLSR